MSTDTSKFSCAQMACFVAVVETGSLASAARRLGLSTSGVSKTLSRLEDSYGIKLMHRSTHALSLTDEGERLLGLARDAVQSVSELEAAMGEAGIAGKSGRVRVSGPTALVGTRLLPNLPDFMRRFPDVRMDIRCTDQFSDLAEDGIDIAIRSGNVVGTPGYIQHMVKTFGWVTCASPAYSSTPWWLTSNRKVAARKH